MSEAPSPEPQAPAPANSSWRMAARCFSTRSGTWPQGHRPRFFAWRSPEPSNGLGATTARAVNVRILAATNQDLSIAIREGNFRQDLYFRLAGVTLTLAPLRDRRDDIPLLIERFWAELRSKYKRAGPELTSSAILRLREAPWPGNVRQLRNTVERIFVLARGKQVTEQEIEASIGSAAEGNSCPEEILATTNYREARRRFEIAYLTAKLREHGGNVTRTAAAIGLERQSLQEKIRQLGISRT